MGLRYRRSIKLGRGKNSPRINIGKNSMSLSVGVGPLRQCYSTTGRTTTTLRTGIPGLYYQTSSSKSSNSTRPVSHNTVKPSAHMAWYGWLLILLELIVCLAFCIISSYGVMLFVCLASYTCVKCTKYESDYNPDIPKEDREEFNKSVDEFTDWYNDNFK